MPRPNPLWYPTSLPDQALWHKVFSEQAQADGTTHGLTAGEVTQIVNDYNMVTFLANVIATLDTYDDSIRGFRRNVMEEPIDGSTPAFPADISFTPPTAVPRGIWERVIEFANRIKASAGYNVGIGESYGIVPSTPTPPPPESVQPTIEVSAAVHGYLFSVVVSGRAESDGWEVWIRPAAAGGAYTLAATATGKSVDVTYEPDTEGESVALQVYVQLRKNNADYGDPSEIGLVTVNP